MLSYRQRDQKPISKTDPLLGLNLMLPRAQGSPAQSYNRSYPGARHGDGIPRVLSAGWATSTVLIF